MEPVLDVLLVLIDLDLLCVPLRNRKVYLTITIFKLFIPDDVQQDLAFSLICGHYKAVSGSRQASLGPNAVVQVPTIEAWVYDVLGI